MPFKYEDVIYKRVDGLKIHYDDAQILLYNLSVGMGRDPDNKKEFPFVYENPELLVVPTAATVIGGSGGNILSNVDINWAALLHGEQRLKVHRPIPPAADLIGSTRISEIVDKGKNKGAVITMEMHVKLANGAPLYTMETVIFARGDGGCGGPEKSVHTPHEIPQRAPDLIHVSQTRPDQGLLYRLNGDRNPLHADPKVARQAGFPQPILHGLCNYGIACRAVLASVCDYDPRRMHSFDVRMTSPAFPGETVLTDIWIDDNVASFRCSAEARDVILLDNGRCEYSDIL